MPRGISVEAKHSMHVMVFDHKAIELEINNNKTLLTREVSSQVNEKCNDPASKEPMLREEIEAETSNYCSQIKVKVVHLKLWQMLLEGTKAEMYGSVCNYQNMRKAQCKVNAQLKRPEKQKLKKEMK